MNLINPYPHPAQKHDAHRLYMTINQPNMVIVSRDRWLGFDSWPKMTPISIKCSVDVDVDVDELGSSHLHALRYSITQYSSVLSDNGYDMRYMRIEEK